MNLDKSRKIRLGILFGGKSAEHEISLISAKNIIEGLDKEKYDVFLIGIDKSGAWRLYRNNLKNRDCGKEVPQNCDSERATIAQGQGASENRNFEVKPTQLNPDSSVCFGIKDGYSYLMHCHDPKLICLQDTKECIALIPASQGKELVSCFENQLTEPLPLDVIFPVLHGTYGEDGTVQGLLKLANIPFVGAGVLGSSIGMDKDVMKRLLRDAGIPTAKFLTIHAWNRHLCEFESVVSQVGLPFFIKPANSGSSVGISKVKSKQAFEAALENAFLYDRKILIEECIPGREIECSVLGNEDPIASLPGELIPKHEFYSYEAKYLDEEGAQFQIPAYLPQDIIEKTQNMAIQTYRALCCEGMARVDFFLKNDALYVNEINTIPGFTKISMYPKLWAISGISYSSLLDRLIELAIERHKKESLLRTSL